MTIHHIFKIIGAVFTATLLLSLALSLRAVADASPASEQVFYKNEARDQVLANKFGSEKRRVPTGSNHLHNK